MEKLLYGFKRHSISSLPPLGIILMSLLVSIILCSLSSYRHYLLQSNAFDLGIFDQFLWLESSGLDQPSSLLGLRMLADHGAFILIPISMLYRLLPGPHVLFAIQAIALAFTSIPLWIISKKQGASNLQSWSVCLTWWLAPVLFNGNLFDFHPEVCALPILGFLFVFLKDKNWMLVVIMAFLCLLTRDGMVLITLGISMSLLSRKDFLVSGLIAAMSLAWISFLVLILYPSLGKSGDAIHAAGRYSHLGNSLFDFFERLFAQPVDLIQHTQPLNNIFYLLILFAPFVFLLLRSDKSILLGIVPLVLSNLLSSNFSQKTLIHHYSLPAVLIIVVSTITYSNFKPSQTRYGGKYYFVLVGLCWCLLAKPGFFFDIYRSRVDMIREVGLAKNMILPDDSMITTSYLAPHFTRRPDIVFPSIGTEVDTLLANYNVILLKPSDPGWRSSKAIQNKILNKARLSGWSCEDIGSGLNFCRNESFERS